MDDGVGGGTHAHSRRRPIRRREEGRRRIQRKVPRIVSQFTSPSWTSSSWTSSTPAARQRPDASAQAVVICSCPITKAGRAGGRRQAAGGGLAGSPKGRPSASTRRRPQPPWSPRPQSRRRRRPAQRWDTCHSVLGRGEGCNPPRPRRSQRTSPSKVSPVESIRIGSDPRSSASSPNLRSPRSSHAASYWRIAAGV